MDRNYGDPSTLGLVAFGMTTVLLGIHNAGWFELDSMIHGMGIFYGGLAQVIAGIMEFKRGDSFGTTAFIAFGLFWWAYLAIYIMPRMGLTGYAPESDPKFIGWFQFMWGVFTGIMSIGSLRYPKAKQFVFISLTILFFVLAIANWAEDDTTFKVAGWVGVVCGTSAIYFGFATLLNAEFGVELFPVGGPTWLGPRRVSPTEPAHDDDSKPKP